MGLTLPRIYGTSESLVKRSRGLLARLVEHALAAYAPSVHQALRKLELVYPSFGLSVSVERDHRAHHRPVFSSFPSKAISPAIPDALARPVPCSGCLRTYLSFLVLSVLESTAFVA